MHSLLPGGNGEPAPSSLVVPGAALPSRSPRTHSAGVPYSAKGRLGILGSHASQHKTLGLAQPEYRAMQPLVILPAMAAAINYFLREVVPLSHLSSFLCVGPLVTRVGNLPLWVKGATSPQERQVRQRSEPIHQGLKNRCACIF